MPGGFPMQVFPMSVSRTALSTFALLVALPGLALSQRDVQSWLDDCRRGARWDDHERFCEVREKTIPASKSVSIDPDQNGGIHVHGWDKSEIRIVSMVQTQADEMDQAKELASKVTVETGDGRIRADGPSTRRHQS